MKTPSWRRVEAVREGWQSFRFGRWRAVGLHSFVVLAVAVPLAADLIGIQRTLNSEQAWLHDGGSVLIATSKGGVSRSRCERLNRIKGVLGSGAVTVMPTMVASVAPEEPITVIGATGGIARVLGLPVMEGNAIVSADLAADFGWREGAFLRLSTIGAPRREGLPDPVNRPSQLLAEPIRVGAVADAQLLAEEHASAVFLEQNSTGISDACYVRVDPRMIDGLANALPALVAPDAQAEPVLVASRLISGKYTQNFARNWEHRALRRAPWAAGVLIGLIWLLVRWTTRGIDGLYRTLGAGRGAVVLVRLTEWAAQLSFGVVTGLLSAGALAAQSGVTVPVIALECLRYGVIVALTATIFPLIWALAPHSSALSALKDRQ